MCSTDLFRPPDRRRHRNRGAARRACSAARRCRARLARPPRLLDGDALTRALGGGKRLRPFLVVESCRAVRRRPRDGALLAGCALELLHCYSLVHDDLPAMDNDDLRRGRPTVHKAFDEATAILAGDALLTLAFDILARDEVHADAKPCASRWCGNWRPRRRIRRHGRRTDARSGRRRPLRAKARPRAKPRSSPCRR